MNRRSTKSKPLSPLCDGQSFAIVRKEVVRSLVSCLFCVCRPANIPRFVIAALIGVAIQAVFFAGAVPHVCKEVNKRLSPPLANVNANRAVTGEVSVTGIVATRDHSLPDFVFRCASVTVCLSAVVESLPEQATATLYVAAPESTTKDFGFFTAFTSTLPERAPLWSAPGMGDYSQSPKPLTEQINSKWMQAKSGVARIGISHDAFSNNGLWLEPRGADNTVSGSLLRGDQPARWTLAVTSRHSSTTPGWSRPAPAIPSIVRQPLASHGYPLSEFHYCSNSATLPKAIFLLSAVNSYQGTHGGGGILFPLVRTVRL